MTYSHVRGWNESLVIAIKPTAKENDSTDGHVVISYL
jgi:hypothetical protein